MRFAGSKHAAGHDDHHDSHGHHDDHHHGHFDKSKHQQTQFKVTSQEELDFQMPKKGIVNERFHRWVAGKWAVDRDDILSNDKVNKYSAYYWWGSLSL